MKWGVICIILLSFIELAYSRTRSEVIHDAYTYSGLEWTVGENNILDVKHCDINASTATDRMVSGGNNIDDRSEYYDVKLQTCAASDGLWPYSIGQSVRGEAYAWGGYNGSNLWGADSTETFKNRIWSQSEKWIAGRDTGDNLPLGYVGFTGSDCSGFVGNSLDINRLAPDQYKYNVEQLKNEMLPVSLEEMERGDVFASQGHILMFERWVNEYNRAHVLHQVPYRYSDNSNVWRAVSEDVDVQRSGSVVRLYNAHNENPWVPHGAYSAFPKISCIKCADTETEVVLGVKSKRALNLESARIIVDEGLESGTTIYAQDLETISSVDGNNINVATVSWAVALNSEISVSRGALDV